MLSAVRTITDPSHDRATTDAEIDRRRGLPHREFVRQYLRPQKPVIIEDAISHWPALGTWTPEFFRNQFGLRSVTVDGRDYALTDLLDRIERSTAGQPAPYLRNLLIADWAPELLQDILPMPACTTPNWLSSKLFHDRETTTAIELYIGGAGASFPVLHYDGMHTHAFLMQLHGTKEYVAYAPDQAKYLYPRAGIERNKSSVPDIDNPDLTRFPLFASAKPVRGFLRAGETLFVPSGWWHTARIVEPAITVSINTANTTNWAAFRSDYLESLERHQPKWRTAAVAFYMTLFQLFEQAVSGV
jgi:hypothetical protein